MAFELGPWFMKVNYKQLGYQAHVMTHSIDEWIDAASTNDAGRLRVRDGSDVDAVDGLLEFFGVLTPFFGTDVSFNSVTVYHQPDPAAFPTPVMAHQFIGVGGEDATPGWHVASEGTISWRTTEFNLVKLTLLDIATNDEWSKITILPGSGKLFDLHTWMLGDTCFVKGRDGAYANVFLSQTMTLNEKLRKAAGLT